MFIAIVGTRFSGKSSVEQYLISKGFIPVKIVSRVDTITSSLQNSSTDGIEWVSDSGSENLEGATKELPSSTYTTRSEPPLYFPSASKLLEYVTTKWRDNFVTVDLYTRGVVELFIKRPFFMLLSVDAPLYRRYGRSKESSTVSLEDFVREDDEVVFGVITQGSGQPSSLHSLSDLVTVRIINGFENLSCLHSHLDELELLNPDHLRPAWDDYFMTLASLASRRSNCMKRRVGAVLVRENRILATGYNGTPRGLSNCNEGGCPRCNGISLSSECVCLHAEENALLEAGRERIGVNSVLYCNTCPCLKCTIKIIQTGVRLVVYNLSYKVDDDSATLFKEAGVELRRCDPNKYHLPAGSDHSEMASPFGSKILNTVHGLRT